MVFHLRVFFVFFLSLAVFSMPCDSHAESLEAAVLSAVENHPSSKGASFALGASEKERSAEFSGFFPEFSTGNTWGRVFQDNSTSRGLSVTRGDAYSYFGEGSVSLTQPLSGTIETFNRYKSADARVQSADSNLDNTLEGLAFRTVQSYIDVLRSRTGLSMLNGHFTKVQNYEQRISNMVSEGAADEAELQQAKEILVILKGLIADYENQVRSAEANYVEVVGHVPSAEVYRPAPRYDLIPESSNEAIAHAIEHHPSLVSAKETAIAAGYDINAERAALIPDLDGELSYLKSDKDDVIGGEVEDARAVVRLNWNFSTGGAQLARIKQRRYEHQESIQRMKETQRGIERGVRLSYSEYKTAQDQLDNIKKRVALNSELLKTYQAQFEGALISQLQLMRADNQLLNTKLEEMNGEHRLLLSGYAILASVGRLQEALNLNAPVLDDKH